MKLNAVILGIIFVASKPTWASAQDFPPPPQPNPFTAPSMPSGVGTWTFGTGGSSAVSISYPAIDPRVGRIEQVVLGAGTDYANPNVTVTNTLGQNSGVNGIAYDTITASGGGLSATHTDQVTFSCLSPPCVSSQRFTSNFGFSNSTSFSTLNVPYTNNSAAAFVATNQSLYGPQTVTLGSTTQITNVNGSITQYSITGNYNVGYNRVYAPWTSDDVVHSLLNVPQTPQLGAMVINPQPALGFTAQQAANLSGYTNFNYLQTFTLSGTLTSAGNLAVTSSGPIFPGDTSKISDFDPLIGGNQGQTGDKFAPYWDQVKLPGQSVNEVIAHNFGLQFEDAPNLQVAGRFLAFQTELVGVTQQDANNLTYGPLTLTSNGNPDPTLIFNWVYYQELTNCTDQAPGQCFVVTAGQGNSSSPSGIAFFWATAL